MLAAQAGICSRRLGRCGHHDLDAGNVDWNLQNPKGQHVNTVRTTSSDITARITDRLTELST